MNKSFDKILSFEVDDASVDYGFVFGDSQKIFFIKAGAHGSMNGYHDKYLSIALNAREKIWHYGCLRLQSGMRHKPGNSRNASIRNCH